MPYIDQADRATIDLVLDPLLKFMRVGLNAGEVNYIVTRVIRAFIRQHGIAEPNYSVYNDAISILECAKLELYRRAVAPYEDKKKEENGDVY